MKSESDQDYYYFIQNGTLLRKVQQFSANKAVMRMPDNSKSQSFVPGPGAYKPRVGSLTADNMPSTKNSPINSQATPSQANIADSIFKVKDKSLYSQGFSST